MLRKEAAATTAYTFLVPDGGWSAVLRVETPVPDEDLAMRLLEEEHVLVHPGTFFSFPFGQHIVLSLLTDPATFLEGVQRIRKSSMDQR